MSFTRIIIGWCALGLLIAGAADAPHPPKDQWLTNAVPLPPRYSSFATSSNDFAGLNADAIAGRMKVRWPAPTVSTNAEVFVVSSADYPGHWPTRDWKALPMMARAGAWEASLPVDIVDVPVAYFVICTESRITTRSPIRVFLPREAGLEEPSRPFWPFLEGFEETLNSWQLLSNPGNTTAFRTNAIPKNGHAALVVPIPAGRHSVTIGTTRVRGWQIEQHFATGLRLWLRTDAGKGQARFALLSNAFTTNEVTSAYSNTVSIASEWQPVDLRFRDFSRLQYGEVDYFTIEFLGDEPKEFWVDDLSLLGRWRLEVE